MSTQSRIAIFASGSGSNAEEIFKYFQGHASIEVVLLLSNNPEAYALERAKKFHIPTLVFNRKQWRESEIVLEWLKEKEITHVVLAGFLWLVPVYLIRAFPGKIINIHPALLPKFGGKGMYGMKVHEAVKASGDTETGITIHEVNEQYDEGKILHQSKCVVTPNDSPNDIAQKIHQLEYVHYPRIIEQWIKSNPF
ncbi:MAG: phosphoribosylglycinamide formyltransferase [Cyclobacteriaceae bacterium]|nr:phosphoribosylglycinamide formyltransferase [Cyclobacteriaceae bacterium]